MPHTCCKTPSPGCGERDHPSNIEYSGCRVRLAAQLAAEFGLVSRLSLAVALLQVLGVILTASLVSITTDTKNDKAKHVYWEDIQRIL